MTTTLEPLVNLSSDTLTIREVLEHANTHGTITVSSDKDTFLWVEFQVSHLGLQWNEERGVNEHMFEYEDASTEKCEMSARALIEKYEGTLFTIE